MLQYNKLYQSLKKVSAEWHAGHVQWQYSWNYLKFYNDGTVIYCGTPTDDIKQINSWFDKDIKDVFLYKGTYRIENKFKIFINIPVSIGHLHLDGCIQNNSLILRSSNKETKIHEYWDEYKLID